MGCGRSGTTIMGFILGNGETCLDLGEVADFLKRKGEPNGFEPETPNGRFWKAVTAHVVGGLPDVFEENISSSLTAVERHAHFVPLLCGFVSKDKIRKYRQYVQFVYDGVKKEAGEYSFFIDSSKYPGRAYLLAKHLKMYDVCIIHLVRHPVKLIRSFGDKEKKQGNKNLLSANLYYFVINLFCLLVKLTCSNTPFIKVKYEDVIARPAETLDEIAKRLKVNLDGPIRKIREGGPLDRGFIFNGNRMRIKEKVVLRAPGEPKSAPGFDWALTMLCNYFWYR